MKTGLLEVLLPFVAVITLHLNRCQSETVTHGYCPPTIIPQCNCLNGTVNIVCTNLTSLPLVNATNVILFTLINGDIDVIEKVPYKNLNSLNLENNQIRYVKDNAFTELNKLQFMYLKHNEISGLTPKTFAGLKNIKTISISFNRLHFLGRGVFSHRNTPELTEIRMEQTELYEIESRSFSLLKHLVYLNVSYNHLHKLPEFHALDELDQLTTVDFSGNLIQRMSGAGLGNLKHLQTLLLHTNQMRSITYADMHGLEDSLSLLDLSHNYIHYIEAVSFAGMTKLRVLKLNNNKIRSLFWEELPWNALNKITLFGNPWHCSCNNSFLIGDSIKMIRVYNDHGGTQCGSPVSVAGEALYKVDRHMFDCDDTRHNTVKTALFISLAVVFSLLLFIGAAILIRVIKRHKCNNNQPYYKVTANGGIHM